MFSRIRVGTKVTSKFGLGFTGSGKVVDAYLDLTGGLFPARRFLVKDTEGGIYSFTRRELQPVPGKSKTGRTKSK